MDEGCIHKLSFVSFSLRFAILLEFIDKRSLYWFQYDDGDLFTPANFNPKVKIHLVPSNSRIEKRTQIVRPDQVKTANSPVPGSTHLMTVR